METQPRAPSQPSSECQLHLTLPEPRSRENKIRPVQTLPVEASSTGSNIKAKVAGLELSDRQTFLTPVSCYKETKANFVQKQLAVERTRPGEALVQAWGTSCAHFPSSPPGLLSYRHQKGESKAKAWGRRSR